MTEPFVLKGVSVAPGTRKKIFIDIGSLYETAEIQIPVEVIHGKKKGPVLFISAAVHGDEINGVAIIKKLMQQPILKNIHGTLILIPIVNVYGFIHRSRYLPDRRDLNRCFPGSPDGSLAARIAHHLITEIVDKSTYGIDLHTGAIHRPNLPHIRANLQDEKTAMLAHAFSTAVIINSSIPAGSLREAAQIHKVPICVYEAGEALRFNDTAIKIGLKGILSVMNNIGMIHTRHKDIVDDDTNTYIAKTSFWVRSPASGLLFTNVHLGHQVNKGDVLGVLTTPFGDEVKKIIARKDGIVIGILDLPLINLGDAIYHIATFDDTDSVGEEIDSSDLYL